MEDASRYSLMHASYRVPWDLFPYLVLVLIAVAAAVGAVCIAGQWCSGRWHPQWRQPAVLQRHRLLIRLLRLLVVLLRPLLLLQVPPHL